MNDRKILANNITSKRLEQKLSRSEVAKASNISLMAYSNIENGISLPKDGTLAKIAYVLGTDLNDLWLSKDCSNKVRFRADNKLIMRGRLLDKTEAYVDLLRKLKDFNKVNSYSSRFSLFIDALKKEKKEPQSIALKLRYFLEIGEEPIDGLLYLLDSNGIELFSCRAQTENFKSFSGIYNGIGPLIVFNSWEMFTVEEIIFNIAHELGHIVLHPYVYDIFESENDLKEDKEADEFATYFLMTDKNFKLTRDYYKNLELIDYIVAIKHKFKVGWHKVAERLEKLDNNDWVKKIEKNFLINGLNLRVHKEPNSLSREVLFKDYCKESFIPKKIINGLHDNKLKMSDVEELFGKKDLNNVLDRFESCNFDYGKSQFKK